MANLVGLVSRFNPGKMLGSAVSGGVSRFRSNIGSGDKGYRVMMRGYSTIRSFERRFASRDSGKSRPTTGQVGTPTRHVPTQTPISAGAGTPARTDHIPAGEEFTHKGNVYIVPEGHVFDTRSGRLIADPAISKSRAFVSFAKAGVIMQSSFDNFKTVTFRKLDKIIDLVGKLQPSPVVAAPPEEVKKPEEGAPEKEKPGNWLPFLAGMLSTLGLKYFVRPLVALFQGIIRWITGLWTAVRNLFTRIANAIINAFKRFWQFMTKIKNAFMKVVSFIKNLIPKAWNAIKEIGKRIGKFFTEKFKAAKDFIVKRLTAVKDYLIKLGARALAWLGKMLLAVVPSAVLSTLKSGSAAAKAVEAAKAAKAPSGAASLLANAKGPGMKLLRALGRIPGVNFLATAGFAIHDIHEADEKFAIDKDEKSHNIAVGNIIAGAMGAYTGGAIGAFLGVALTKGLIASGAIAGSVVPVAGTAVGGLIGLGLGVASTLALTVGGAVGGDWAFRKLLNHYGSPEAFGAAINSALDALKSDDISQTRILSTQLDQQIHELTMGSARNQAAARAAALGTLNKMRMQKIIDDARYTELRNSIRQASVRGSSTQSEIDTMRSQPGPSTEYDPGAPIGGRIAGDRVGPRATPRVIGDAAPPASNPPADTPPPATPPSATPTAVQPVPAQTPPAPHEQGDEFQGTVIINSQTNRSHTTNVMPGQSPTPRPGSTSPDPWHMLFP